MLMKRLHFTGQGWLKQFFLWWGVLFLHIIYATANYEKIRRQARPCWRLKTPLEIWKWKKKTPLLLSTYFMKYYFLFVMSANNLKTKCGKIFCKSHFKLYFHRFHKKILNFNLILTRILCSQIVWVKYDFIKGLSPLCGKAIIIHNAFIFSKGQV